MKLGLRVPESNNQECNEGKILKIGGKLMPQFEQEISKVILVADVRKNGIRRRKQIVITLR